MVKVKKKMVQIFDKDGNLLEEGEATVTPNIPDNKWEINWSGGTFTHCGYQNVVKAQFMKMLKKTSDPELQTATVKIS